MSSEKGKVELKEESSMNYIQIAVIVLLLVLVGVFLVLWIFQPITAASLEQSQQHNEIPVQARCEFTPRTGISMSGYCKLSQEDTKEMVSIECDLTMPIASTEYTLYVHQRGRTDGDCANVGDPFYKDMDSDNMDQDIGPFTTDGSMMWSETIEVEGLSLVGRNSILGRSIDIMDNGCCVIGYSDVAT